MAESEQRTTASGEKKGDQDRKDRLAVELRANLARRKAQARSRRQGLADARPDGLDGGGKDDA